MEKRNNALIVTIAAALLCGLPGLCTMFFGAMFALISQIPGADIDVVGSSDPASALSLGLGALCAGLLLLVVPIVVGFFALRKKPGDENLSTG